jgi:DNA-binding CsgD family transcriptional regulator
VPEALYNLLGVAAHTEADAVAEGWPDPDPDTGTWVVGQVRQLLGLMTPMGPVQKAQDAHIRADLARWADDDDAAIWAQVVALWRRVPHPRSLALALVRLGTVAAGAGDKKGARDALAEALHIAERLPARPLETFVHEIAKAHDLRIGSSAGTRANGTLLTGRELEVLRLLADGASNADIAAQLFISPKTVSVHVSHILEKLGVASRTAAAARARKAGLLATEETQHAGANNEADLISTRP